MKKFATLLVVISCMMLCYISILSTELKQVNSELETTHEEMTKAIMGDECYLEWQENGKTYKYIRKDNTTIKVTNFTE